ncbi:hypothetical protein M413DRAFT_448106, partial [Hebeloma cylindrosporum]
MLGKNVNRITSLWENFLLVGNQFPEVHSFHSVFWNWFLTNETGIPGEAVPDAAWDFKLRTVFEEFKFHQTVGFGVNLQGPSHLQH